MRNKIKYLVFCIKYWLRKQKRKREYVWDQEDGWDSWYTFTCSLCGKINRYATLTYKDHLSCRMFNPDGDIFKAYQEEQLSRGEITGYMIDGEDILGIYDN